jgi:NAD+ synthase (glutamine-hydrolysing)
MLSSDGFVRVAAAVPPIKVADCLANAASILELMDQAEREEVGVLVFPELCLTGYTCADLFGHAQLHEGAEQALARVVFDSRSVYSGLAVVGLPVAVDEQLFNCGVVFQDGRILGVIPKTFLPTYSEFYEARWFAPAAAARSSQIRLLGATVPFGTETLFAASDRPGLVVGVEICEDIWVPIPPSSTQALGGASVLVNLSASNEVIGKAAYRRQLVLNHSGRCLAAYVYSSCGVGESTTDVVFGGHSFIAENGSLLAESPRFQRQASLLVADVDLGLLRSARLRTGSFAAGRLFPETQRRFAHVPFTLGRPTLPRHLRRTVEPHPFVPRGREQLRERCGEIFQTQVAALATRLEHLRHPAVAIGVSGGLDSTLALLVTCKTMDVLGEPRQRIRAFTMPGFGTTVRTRSNASALMEQLGVSAEVVDIRSLCIEEMRAIGHSPFGLNLDGLDVEEFCDLLRRLPADRRHDLVFENVQARMRTSILMNSGFVIGTGDLSEAALGWSTYNGDHMSMYNPNTGIPKTLVKFLVRWAAENEFDGTTRQTLLDIVDTEVSPELLPPREDGQIAQATEGIIGPYELHDFFLYHFVRHGAPPEKILYLAAQAKFDGAYSADEVRRWLRLFLQRFFGNQFKRSCIPDGPKVGSVSLSPRGDWRMPSDAQVRLWLQGLQDARQDEARPKAA